MGMACKTRIKKNDIMSEHFFGSSVSTPKSSSTITSLSSLRLCKAIRPSYKKVEVPGDYAIVDHSIFRTNSGAVGTLHVAGSDAPEIYNRSS
jgi:hypothetical protein